MTGETFKASITNLTTRVNSYEFSYKFELINEKGIYKVSGVCGFVRGYMEGSALDPLQFVPFGNGGSSDPYVLPVATDAILGGVKSNAAENGILVDAEGLMSVNTLNVNKLVGDLELDCGGAEVE